MAAVEATTSTPTPTTTSSDILKIRTSDEQKFSVPKDLILPYSKTIANMISDMEGVIMTEDDFIPLPNVDGTTFAKIIEFCKLMKIHLPNFNREEAEKNTEKKPDLADWEIEFTKVDDPQELFNIILASNYLEIKHLLDTACKAVAEAIKGKTTEEIRETFGEVVKSWQDYSF